MRMLIRRRHDDEGAVAIIASVSVVLLFLIVGLTIDLGFARADVRTNQTISDFAAIAASQEIGNGYAAACRRALEYIHANSPELASPPAAAVLAQCDVFGTMGTPDDPCTESTDSMAATITVDPYTIRVTGPVDDDDPAMTTGGQAVAPELDGDRCQRIKVEVVRDRNYIFGVVGGIMGGTPGADAVARRTEIGGGDEYSSLIVLDREACRVLWVSGQGSVTVDNYEGPDPDSPLETIILPGQVTLDTLANLPGNSVGNNQCGASNARAIDISNNTSAFLRAEGDIKSFGLREGRPVDKIYDAALLSTLASDGEPKLRPQPIPGRMQTRSPVDHIFNCRSTYRETSELWQPADDIAACPDAGDIPPYVELLVDALQGPGVPAGYSVFPDDVLGASCTTATPFLIDGSLPLINNRWLIDCPNTGQAFNPANVSFLNMEVVISNNRISLGSSNQLTVRGDNDTAAILYVRNGGIEKGAQASLTIRNTFTYLHDGVVDAGAGDPVLTIRGALSFSDPSPCDSYTSLDGMPPPSCFSPLALWSNSSDEHRIGGQAPMNIAGTFFTPNARPFNLAGQAGQVLTEAQFFSRRIQVSGQGAITLVPNPNTNVPTPEFGTGLIR